MGTKQEQRNASWVPTHPRPFHLPKPQLNPIPPPPLLLLSLETQRRRRNKPRCLSTGEVARTRRSGAKEHGQNLRHARRAERTQRKIPATHRITPRTHGQRNQGKKAIKARNPTVEMRTVMIPNPHRAASLTGRWTGYGHGLWPLRLWTQIE